MTAIYFMLMSALAVSAVTVNLRRQPGAVTTTVAPDPLETMTDFQWSGTTSLPEHTCPPGWISYATTEEVTAARALSIATHAFAIAESERISAQGAADEAAKTAAAEAAKTAKASATDTFKTARRQPQAGARGHCYQRQSSALSYAAAKAKCGILAPAIEFRGLKWPTHTYLAVPNSAAENAFLAAKVGGTCAVVSGGTNAECAVKVTEIGCVTGSHAAADACEYTSGTYSDDTWIGFDKDANMWEDGTNKKQSGTWRDLGDANLAPATGALASDATLKSSLALKDNGDWRSWAKSITKPYVCEFDLWQAVTSPGPGNMN